MSELRCPRCATVCSPAAHFCGRCGISLQPGVGGLRQAGRIAHPSPGAPPEGASPVDDAAQLYFRLESSLGGEALLGTEGLRVWLYNSGYPLRDVELQLTGVGSDGRTVLCRQQRVAELRPDRPAEFEIPSYDLSEPLEKLAVRLLRAEFLRND